MLQARKRCAELTLQYLGPSLMQMLGLFLLTLINTITLFAVGINLLRSLWSVWNNITTIESWEIDRHKALLRRAKTMGGYLDGPNGEKIRIKKQEFPYDIGIYSNLVQALGSNPLTWLWPLASTISDDSGLDFEVNGFEGGQGNWEHISDAEPSQIHSRHGHRLILTA